MSRRLPRRYRVIPFDGIGAEQPDRDAVSAFGGCVLLVLAVHPLGVDEAVMGEGELGQHGGTGEVIESGHHDLLSRFETTTASVSSVKTKPTAAMMAAMTAPWPSDLPSPLMSSFSMAMTRSRKASKVSSRTNVDAWSRRLARNSF